MAGANVEKPVPSFEKGGVVSDVQGATTGEEGKEAIIPLEKVHELIGKDPLAEEAKRYGKDELPQLFKDLPSREKLPITQGRWEQAQKAERAQHTFDHTEGVIHYGKAYRNYFKFLGLGNNLHGLNVIEVGPADFPALEGCSNWGRAIIIEPMPSEILLNTCKAYGFELFTEAFELAMTHIEKIEGFTEVWLLNVMQHVIDPEVFVNTAKQFGDRIRFFEPIDQPITEYHPHTYGLKDFQRWFGSSVNLYAGGSVEGFHEADCAYGVWIKEQ